MNNGELIRSYRKKKGLTMKDLGYKVGVSEQAISQYERSLRTPSVKVLQKICYTLGLPIENFSYDYKPIPTSKDIDKDPSLMLKAQIEQFIDDVDQQNVQFMCKLIESFNYSIEIDKNVATISDSEEDNICSIIPINDFIATSKIFNWEAEVLITNFVNKYSSNK